MNKPKNVCPKDCPGRKMGCHTSCEKYQRYRSGQLEEYREREKTTRIMDYQMAACRQCTGRKLNIYRKPKEK